MASNHISWKAVSLVVILFVLGIALGGVGAHLWDAHVLAANEKRPSVVARLKSELQLSPSQTKQFDSIISQEHAAFHAIQMQQDAEWKPKYQALDAQRHAEWDPKWEQARRQGRESLRAILTPEQQVKFDAFVKQLDEERRKEQAEARGH